MVHLHLSILSDRGKSFLNEIMQTITQKLEIYHKKTTVFHPQTNGNVERFNKTLTNIMSMC